VRTDVLGSHAALSNTQPKETTMQIQPYLNFDGRCREAFIFYQGVLGGEVTLETHGESPMREHTPPAWHDRILHARLVVGDQELMGSDSPPDQHATPQGFAVSLNFDSAEEAERVFAALAEGGSVQMPLQETFWASRFGMCTDRFGVPWMANYGQGS
jgi:PhnB protein